MHWGAHVCVRARAWGWVGKRCFRAQWSCNSLPRCPFPSVLQEEGSLAVREILQQAAASAGANGSGFSLTPGTGLGLVGAGTAGAAGAVASAPVGGGAEVASAYHPLSRAGLGQQAQQHAGAMPTLRALSVPLLPPPPPVAPPGAGGPQQQQAQGPGLAQQPAQQQGPEQGHATGAADHTEQVRRLVMDLQAPCICSPPAFPELACSGSPWNTACGGHSDLLTTTPCALCAPPTHPHTYIHPPTPPPCRRTL